MFHSGVHLHGGPAPVRRFLPELIQLIWDREIDPGVVFDLSSTRADVPSNGGRGSQTVSSTLIARRSSMAL
jgi:hypothetical protein